MAVDDEVLKCANIKVLKINSVCGCERLHKLPTDSFCWRVLCFCDDEAVFCRLFVNRLTHVLSRPLRREL